MVESAPRTEIPKSSFLIFATLALAFVLPSFAQVDTARIIGSVKDPSGSSVPAARVVLTNVDTGISHETVTRDNGSYESIPLRIGEYQVAVESTGFKRAVRSGVILRIQQTAVVDFIVEVGDVTQEISVMASAPLLTVNEATQGQVIDNRQMVELPLNGREYGQLALLSAGTNEPANGARVGGFSGSGMRATQNNYLLDGVDNNNAQIAYQGRQAEVVRPNIDAIQEFKV
ncbi:MAG: carboxypeptidase-like regulatory domain-containing protein, partial [Bryobacteraceae bacterium]